MVEPETSTLHQVDVARQAQQLWAQTPLAQRLAVLRRARYRLAEVSERLVDAISLELPRNRADSYGAEVLPLLWACRYLEKNAQKILKARRLGRRGLPLFLAGVDSVIERVPLGVVLVIAPANYPLFLAGAQALQALAAGNAVVWKPGRDGQRVAEVFRDALLDAGLPAGLLRVTDESVETSIAEVKARPDKIIFTGSAQGGRAVLRLAAEDAIPVTVELSGCDVVVALESADAARVVEAMAFGMRLNGSSTCIAPRRLFLVGRGHEALVAKLRERFAVMDGIAIPAQTRRLLQRLTADAERHGATVCGDAACSMVRPVLVLDGQPEMEIAQADIFAPVLTVIQVASVEELLEADRACPFGLAASVFGEERAALAVGERLEVGTVVVNDLIVSTADPRVPFGGRRGSGYGTTRGAEGLLELTAAKVTSVRKGKLMLHYDQTGAAHEELFQGAIAMAHGATWAKRLAGLRRLIGAAPKLK